MKNSWLNSSVGYQIYIRSFKDGNGDGVGDLKGIIEKLDYLKDLGIDYVWICPFYDSPMDDNGYDVRDFFKVDKLFGTNADLKKLIKEAHNRKIRVVLDLVLNHTSNENKWFQKSEQKIEPYTDMYVWKDGKIKSGKLCPPNNWQSIFSGSAWKYSEKRKQYYLRVFSEKMPDLNYESETTFDEIKKVVDYYAKLGIDGFRLDAVSHLAENENYRSVKNKQSALPFSDQPKNHIYLQKLHKCFEDNNLVTLGEVSRNCSKKDLLKYTSKTELDAVFTFSHGEIFNKNHTVDVQKLMKVLKCKNDTSVKGGMEVLFWLNHDYPRLLSKLRNEADPMGAQLCLAALMYFLKGSPLVFNGEELGMENYPFKKPEDFLDVNARMLFENSQNKEATLKHLIEESRDNSRTIMQWSKSKNAGFSTAKPKVLLSPTYKINNAEQQEKEQNSFLNSYKRLLKLRHDLTEIINEGQYKFFNNKGLMGYDIKSKSRNIKIIANLSKKDIPFEFKNSETLYSNISISQKLKKYQVVILEKRKH